MTMKPCNLVTICLLWFGIASWVTADKDDWFEQGQKRLADVLTREKNTNVAKNLVMMVGVGMGMSTVTAARIYKGQQNGQSGEETQLCFEQFPCTGFLKTYNTDYQNADSAGAQTALLSGVKTKTGVIGLSDKAKYGDCSSTKGAKVENLVDWALKAGKSVGIVTNDRITGANPAAAYAHSASRKWEGDTQLDRSQRGCKDIAYQLIRGKRNRQIQVILGGGRKFFLSKREKDPELKIADEDQRRDRNLVKDWIKDKKRHHKSAEYVWRKKEFDQINPDKTDYVLGLFESSRMAYEHDRDSSPNGEPSLKEMTAKAIQILSKNKNGYFLLVESALIDPAHHELKLRHALEETVMFDETIKLATEMTSVEDTLVLVTAGHSMAFTIGGDNPKRGNDILGLVNDALAGDGLPYTTAFYANGPVQRSDLTGVDTTSFDYQFESGIHLPNSTHSMEDTPIYARGPKSFLFVGTNEQNYVAHAAAYAMDIGQTKGYKG